MRLVLVQHLMVCCSLGDTNGVGFLLDLCEKKYNHEKLISQLSNNMKLGAKKVK